LKRLVIHRQTGHFLNKDGRWSADESKAMHFDTITAVVQTCAKLGVTDAQILLRSENAHAFEVRLPLPQAARKLC